MLYIFINIFSYFLSSNLCLLNLKLGRCVRKRHFRHFSIHLLLAVGELLGLHLLLLWVLILVLISLLLISWLVELATAESFHQRRHALVAYYYVASEVKSFGIYTKASTRSFLGLAAHLIPLRLRFRLAGHKLIFILFLHQEVVHGAW